MSITSLHREDYISPAACLEGGMSGGSGES
jgi:hypothetical protein